MKKAEAEMIAELMTSATPPGDIWEAHESGNPYTTEYVVAREGWGDPDDPHFYEVDAAGGWLAENLESCWREYYGDAATAHIRGYNECLAQLNAEKKALVEGSKA